MRVMFYVYLAMCCAAVAATAEHHRALRASSGAGLFHPFHSCSQTSPAVNKTRCLKMTFYERGSVSCKWCPDLNETYVDNRQHAVEDNKCVAHSKSCGKPNNAAKQRREIAVERAEAAEEAASLASAKAFGHSHKNSQPTETKLRKAIRVKAKAAKEGTSKGRGIWGWLSTKTAAEAAAAKVAPPTKVSWGSNTIHEFAVEDEFDPTDDDPIQRIGHEGGAGIPPPPKVGDRWHLTPILKKKLSGG